MVWRLAENLTGSSIYMKMYVHEEIGIEHYETIWENSPENIIHVNCPMSLQIIWEATLRRDKIDTFCTISVEEKYFLSKRA